MNITGWLRTVTLGAEGESGALSVSVINNGRNYRYGDGSNAPTWKYDMNFNAANAWTGETSNACTAGSKTACAKDASHTHGIKMTVRGNADTADKTSADNGAATATIKVINKKNPIQDLFVNALIIYQY